MTQSTTKTDFRFISEEDYYNKLNSGFTKCVVRMKVFNEEQQTDLDRTVFIEIDSQEIVKIEKCLTEIKNFNFNWAKSFLIEKSIKDLKIE